MVGRQLSHELREHRLRVANYGAPRPLRCLLVLSGLRGVLSRKPRWLVIVAAIYGPLLVVGGVWMFVTSLNGHTETVSARVSTAYVGRSTYVDFKFADGSTDSEYASPSEPFFDAVDEFGPGQARVTRNADNDTIDTVVFHDEKYKLGTEGGSAAAAIAVAVLGLLGVAYAFRYRDRLRRGTPTAGPGAPPQAV